MPKQKGFHILFIGFMGSGKSTVSRRLGRMFKRRVIEQDLLIEKRTGKSIPEIFADEGESGFRAREHSVLESLLLEKDPCIISCGGGVVCGEGNIELLGQLGTVVYLEVTPDEVRRRIRSTDSRPLLNDWEDAGGLLEERRALYERAADITFDTSGKTADEVTNQIGEMLWERGWL